MHGTWPERVFSDPLPFLVFSPDDKEPGGRCPHCRKTVFIDRPPHTNPRVPLHYCDLGRLTVTEAKMTTASSREVYDFFAAFARVVPSPELPDGSSESFCVSCRSLVREGVTMRILQDGKSRNTKSARSPCKVGVGHRFSTAGKVRPGWWFVEIRYNLTLNETVMDHMHGPVFDVASTPGEALGRALQQYRFVRGRRGSFRGLDLGPEHLTARWVKAWAQLLMLEGYDDHCAKLMQSPELLVDRETLLSCDISGQLLSGDE